MALNGIDVSSWQKGIDISKLSGVDFVIAKATEGTGYVNPDCDRVIQQCIKLNKPWGFYHYMKNKDPQIEANYFYKNCLNYFGHGIPILDWEEGQTVTAVNLFVEYIHTKTGIWPWIYGNPWRFNQGKVNANCGRWIASYPLPFRKSLDASLPNIPKTNGLVCAWQFTSEGKVNGYNGNLDLNRFYGTREAWKKYATGGK